MNRYAYRNWLRDLFGECVFSRYGKYLHSVTDIVDGMNITYDFDTNIGRTMYFEGGFEKKEIEFCRKYIKSNSIVLDIGANIGLHSINFSKVVKEGLVFSFEPSSEVFGLLLKNVKDINNIVPVNIGISDSKTITDFYIASDNAYSSLKDTKRKEIKKAVKVVCFPLDEFFKGLKLDNIDFIKIDVEGFEQSVIEGMQWLLEKHRPVVFCEIYKGTNSNEDPERTVDTLIEKGYDAFVFDGGKLVKYEKHVDRFYNYFFLPKT